MHESPLASSHSVIFNDYKFERNYKHKRDFLPNYYILMFFNDIHLYLLFKYVE